MRNSKKKFHNFYTCISNNIHTIHSYTHCQFYAELCIRPLSTLFSFFSDAAAAITLSFGEFHEIFAVLLLQRRLHDVSIVLTVCAKALSTAAARKSRIRKKVASYFHLVLHQFILLYCTTRSF